MFWLIIGMLLFLLIRNQFDMQRTGKDVRRIVRAAGKAAKSAVNAIRDSAQEARKEAEARKTESEPAENGNAVPAPDAEIAEMKENMELLKEMEQKAGTAAMLAGVPTLSFPENDPKYDSSRKYTYA